MLGGWSETVTNVWFTAPCDWDPRIYTGNKCERDGASAGDPAEGDDPLVTNRIDEEE